MNLFFRHFHKTPFWSQLLFGMFAMLALPEIQVVSANESEQETVINQAVVQQEQVAADSEQQSPFIIEQRSLLAEIKPQAVTFCEFFAKSYRLDRQNVYPIRAGPFA